MPVLAHVIGHHPSGGTKGGTGNANARAAQTLSDVGKRLEQAGATFQHFMRTRTYVTDLSPWAAVGSSHRGVFRDMRPAATMVALRRLILPEMLAEIEADAYLGDHTNPRLLDSDPAQPLQVEGVRCILLVSGEIEAEIPACRRLT